jgi:hypothetical protein
MKRIALMIGVVASLLFSGVSTALASPPDTETMITRDNVVSFMVVNLCSGETGTLTLDYTDVLHITQIPGTLIIHNVDVQTGILTFTPEGSTTPSVSGHFGTTFNWQSTPPGAAFTITQPTIYVAHGSDGSNVVVHFLSHVTSTPAGDITSEFDNTTIECVQ